MNLTTNDLVGPCRQRGDELEFETCPVCGTPGYHFAVNIRTGIWGCVAGRHTSGGGFVVDRHNLRRFAQLGAQNDPAPPQEVRLPDTEPILPGSLAYKYLLRRSIPEILIKQLGLRDWKEQFRILIPFFNEGGDVVNYTGRDYLGTSSIKYRNGSSSKTLFIPDLTTGDAAYKSAEYVAVVEGPLDAVRVFSRCAQLGGRWRVVALGGARSSAGSEITAALKRLAAGRRVLVWLDADPAGRAGATSFAAQLRPHADGVVVARPEWYGSCKDPGAMSDDDIAYVLRETEKEFEDAKPA